MIFSSFALEFYLQTKKSPWLFMGWKKRILQFFNQNLHIK